MTVGRYLDSAHPDGESFGQTTSALISFFGYTPIAQRAATAQSAVATAAITAVATTAITAPPAVTPVTSGYGYSTTAQMVAFMTCVADLITRVAAIETAVNSGITRVEAIRNYVAQTRTDLIAYGLQKGSA